MSDTPTPTSADAYETMEALLCEMQGLRDELVEVKRERDEAQDVAKWLYQHSMATLIEGAHRNEWIKEERK